MDDKVFVQSFEECTLSTADFRHHEHIRLAWLYLKRDPLLTALERYRDGIKKFATHHGLKNLYNETMTWAYIFLINERMVEQNSATWTEFISKNDDLFDGAQPTIFKYYTKETLHSQRAKNMFVMPDLCRE